MAFYAYIVASERNGTLYIGSTDNLAQRVWEHAEKHRLGFTAKYNVAYLVWFETYETREAAFRRECQKKWNRIWKIRLIERFNPEWRDLLSDLI